MLFLTSYTVRVLVPGLSPGWSTFWEIVTIVTWGTFIVEYLARLLLSDDRRHFVRTRWLDLIVTVLPLLRPLRIVDLHERMQRRRDHPRLALEARVMAYAGLTSLLLGFAASLAVYHDERGAPDANIRTFGDAVWWAASTLTTTGYGDATPVTGRGRVTGVGLMFLGVALVGAVVGSFSSWLMRRFRQEGER
ncbi:potassium channel family protein [Streptomyces inhibens]|uniref:potassium channel family protein n=1 Tax=Streptomyces inhibens TaxID=2293571 RepID=UPI00379E3F44